MRKYIPIYYLLCVLLVLGAFAAMAQNSYGLALLGLVAGFFSLVFSAQLITYFGKNKKGHDRLLLFEQLALVFISGILCLRVFYIRFPLVEELFIISGLSLAFIFSVRLVHTFRIWISKNSRLAWSVLLFHVSITFYLLSMSLTPLYPQLSEPLGTLAFLSLVLFAVWAVLIKKIIVHGERLSVFSFVNKFRDHSIILVVLFLIFTGYMGLTRLGAIPKIYTDEYPQAYFDLLNRAETGREKPIDGTYQHEAFKTAYDQFVKRNGN